VNDNVMLLLLTLDALKRNHAGKIIVCLPYLAYTRQEKPTQHTSYAPELLMTLIHAAGAHQCITIDPHSNNVNHMQMPLNSVSTIQLFTDHITATHRLDEVVIVAPDQGAIERCTVIHNKLGLNSDLVRIDKIRTKDMCIVQEIHGNVRGKTCLIMDDIVDTGTTLCAAAAALTEQGATKVFAYCTHGVLSGGALDRIQKAPIEKLIITDTIAPKIETLCTSNIDVISVAAILAEHMGLYMIADH
jgi:ribose-phosphate pyrophosphokinase